MSPRFPTLFFCLFQINSHRLQRRADATSNTRPIFCQSICDFCRRQPGVSYPVARLCFPQCQRNNGKAYDTCLAYYDYRKKALAISTTSHLGGTGKGLAMRPRRQDVTVYSRVDFCRLTCNFCRENDAVPYPVTRLCYSQCLEGRGRAYNTCVTIYARGQRNREHFSTTTVGK